MAQKKALYTVALYSLNPLTNKKNTNHSVQTCKTVRHQTAASSINR